MVDLIERLRSVSASYEPARAILLLRNAADLIEKQAEAIKGAAVIADAAGAEIRALKSRITAVQSERDALVNSVAAGGKEAAGNLAVEASEIADELDSIADRITRFSNSTGDGTCARAAQLLRALAVNRTSKDDENDRFGAVELILRDVCETDPADPDMNDTVCIDISDLKIIVERHVSEPRDTSGILEWAVGRWNAEVSNRPLVNVHRRSLDDTWRQVIRHLGGDDAALLGPRHSELLAASPTAALENGDGRDAWISVEERLPKCSRAKGSLGVEVLVWPLTESGEATAFYGRRVTDTPAFYRYGAVINRITHWQPLPSPPAGLSQKTGE